MENIPDIHADNFINWFTEKVFEGIDEPVQIAYISKKIEELWQVFRGLLSTDEYYLALYILFLKSQGIEPNTLSNIDRSDVILKIESIEFGVLPNSEDMTLNAIHNVFAPKIQKLGTKGLNEVLNVLSSIETSALQKFLPQIFEYSLYRLSRIKGRSRYESVLPEELCQLISEIIEVPHNSKIFNPYAGLASFGIYLNGDNEYYGQELVEETWAIGVLRLIIHDKINFAKLECKNSIEDWPTGNTYDLIISSPPFNVSLGQRYNGQFGSHEQFLLEQGIRSLNPHGKLVALLPLKILFSNSKAFRYLRKDIIERDILEAVIVLPGGILYNTSIPSAIVILNKSKPRSKECLFVDISNSVEKSNSAIKKLASETISQVSNHYKSWKLGEGSKELKPYQSLTIHSNEIAANKYNFLPARYLPIKGLENFDLENAISLDKLIDRMERATSNDRGGLPIKKLSIRNLASSTDDYKVNVHELQEVENVKYPVYGGGALLLAKIGGKLKPSHLPLLELNQLYEMHNIYPFTVKEEIVNKEYLIQELNKNYVELQLARYRTGAVIPHLSINDLLQVKIILPPLAEQVAAVKQEKEIRLHSLLKMNGYEKEIIRLKTEQRKDLGSKKHNIMQHLNNVKSSTNVLRKVLNDNGGILKADQIINPKTGVTVLKRLERLEDSVNNVLYYVENLTNEIEFGQAELLNVHTLLGHCVEKGIQNKKFSYIDDSDLESFDEQEPVILVSRRDFEELFNNILENALRHGFIEDKKEYEFRYSVVLSENGVEVLFKNNGKKFPERMGNKDAYCTRGEKAGVNGQTGEGSWKVCQIAQHFGAELIIIDEPESDFPVGIKLIFELEK